MLVVVENDQLSIFDYLNASAALDDLTAVWFCDTYFDFSSLLNSHP